MRDDNDWLEGEGFAMPGKGDKAEPDEPAVPQDRSKKKRKGRRRNAGESYDSMRRSLVIVACFSIAVAVGAMLFSSYRTMQAQELIDSEKANQRAVLVATREIAPGEAIGASDLAEAAIPMTLIPVDAVTIDEAGTLVGKRVTVRLSPGIPVSASAVRESASPATLASAIGDGHVALSLSLDEASGVSPLLRVGDMVDVISQSNDAWSTLVSSVRVLALDEKLGSEKTEGYSRVTLELTLEDAVFVSAAERVRLALHPAEIPGEA